MGFFDYLLTQIRFATAQNDGGAGLRYMGFFDYGYASAHNDTVPPTPQGVIASETKQSRRNGNYFPH